MKDRAVADRVHDGLGSGAQPGPRVWAQVAARAIVAGHGVLAYRLGRLAASAARFGVAVEVLGIARAAGVSWAELGLGRDKLVSGANHPPWEEAAGAFRLDNSRQHSKVTVYEGD